MQIPQVHDGWRRLHTSGLIAGIGLVLILLSGCLTPYEKGSRLYRAEDYERAKSEVEAGLKDSPEDPQLNLLMARLLIAEKEWREAESYARTAFEADATRAKGGRLLGKVYWELGQSFEAVQAWRAARKQSAGIVSDEDFARALVAAIGTAESSRKFKKALQLRKELAEVDPDRQEAGAEAIRQTREKLASDLVQRGEYEEAADAYLELAESADDPAEYAFERGRLLLRLDRPGDATDAFNTFVEADDNKKLNRLLLVARRAESIGKMSVAVDFYQRALERMDGKPSFRRAKLRLQLAGLLYGTGRSKEARAQVESYLEDMRPLRGIPLEAEVYLTAAKKAREAEDNSFATDLLETALQKAPPSWSVASRLARIYAVQARPDEVDRVLQLHINRSKDTEEALQNAAKWARRRQNHDLARVFLERLLERDKDRAQLWLDLAKTYAKLGRIDRFRETLENFRQRFDDERAQPMEIASMYREQKMYEEAEGVMKAAQQEAPKRLLIADRLADLYRDWGKPDRVQDAYTPWIEARGGRAADYQLVGERLMRQRRMRQALPYLKKAAERGNIQAWLEIADVYRNQRRELDMKEALDKYIAQSSSRAHALRNALRRYRSTSLTRQAIATLEDLLELEPGVSSHYRQLGSAYLEQGRKEAAFKLWTKWVGRSTNTISALRTVGRWFGRSGDSDLRLEFYRQWLDEDADPRLHRLIGDAYLETGFRRFRPGRMRGPRRTDARQKARRYYERYLAEANPTRSELESFAESMRKQKMWSTAARTYSRMVESGPPGSDLRFHYAEALMHLGQIDKAIEFFEAYYEARGKTDNDARKIAKQLFDFRKYEAAQPYLEAMFDSSSGPMIRAAFVKLAESYQHSGRLDAIDGLVKKYLSKAPNPAKARQTAVQVLEERGLYAAAARQVERIREFQGNVMGFDLGVNHFRAGNMKKAKAAFREHADNNPYPGAVWLKVAKFWENHARPEAALGAYDRAVDASPDEFQPRARRGRFRLLQGEVDGGLADFRKARELAGADKRETVTKMKVEALLEIGDFGRAREAASQAVNTATQHKQFFLRMMVEGELKAADPSRANRIIDRLAKSDVPLKDTVEILVDNGYRRKAAELLEKQLDSGNLDEAGKTLVRWPDVFTRLGSLERLKRVARPLLDRQGRDQATLRAQIGEFLIRQGDFADGVVYLRSAHDDGRPIFRSVLAQTYALLGRHKQASRLFQQQLGATSPGTRDDMLRRIGLRLELVGQHDRFDSLLRYLARDERYAAIATRFLVGSLLDEGRLNEVMEMVRQTADQAADHRPEGSIAVAEAHEETAVVAALEALAANGYLREVDALIESLPGELKTWTEVRDLQLNMAAHRGDETLRDRALRAASGGASASETNDRRLRVARILSINGRFDLAAEVAETGMRSSAPEQVDATARFLIKNAYAAGDDEALEDRAAQWRERSADKLGVRSALGKQLFELGMDRRAVDRLLPAARQLPTSDRLRRAMRAAAAADNAGVVKEIIEAYVRMGESPTSELASASTSLVDRVDAAVAESIAGPAWRTYPATLRTIKDRAKVAFRAGHPERTRALLSDYLERTNYAPRSVEEVFGFLDKNGMWAEAVRVFADAVPEDAHTDRSLQLLGLAHAQTGHLDAARRRLDAAIDAAPDASEAAVQIAQSLLERDLPSLGMTYGNRAVELGPERPDARLFRGMLRLRNGQVEGARSDLRVGLNSGVNRMYSLFQTGRAALRAGEPEIAGEYLAKLARTPNSANFGELYPLRLAVEAYVSADAAEQGVQFLKQRYPRLASGGGIAARELRSLMTSLYENAGRVERAYEVYRTGIQREAVREPDGTILPVYLNNLAYTFATTDAHLEEGFDLVRRAIAYGDGRTPSYLDTLGWLNYRKGRYAEAARNIQGALASAGGPRSELTELYEHLAAIRKARGEYERAFWLEQFAGGLKRR